MNTDLRERTSDRSQLEWWAQEQVENAANYARIQEDLRLLREEITAHFEGQKGKGNMEGRPATKLGPNTLYQGGLEDHHGLNMGHIVTLDSLIPPVNPMDPQSIGLTQDQINYKGQEGEEQDTNQNSEAGPRTGTESADGNIQVMSNYVVEFPPEEDEEPESHNNTLHEEDERHLAVAMTRALTLKRPRKITNTEDERGKTQNEEQGSKRCRKGSQLYLMAEEASLTMPPVSP